MPRCQNEGRFLTSQEKAIVFGILLTDGWIEMQNKGVNARLGFEQGEVNLAYFNFCCNLLKDWIRATPGEKIKTPPGKKFKTYSIRTITHPEFTKFFYEFRPNKGKKLVPRLSYLMQFLNFEALAHMIMCDGSIKSAESKAIEIHLQSFSYESCCRIAVALYLKLGLKASVTPYGLSKSKKMQYHILISGSSLNIIHKKVLPLMHQSMTYKIPSKRTPRGEEKSKTLNKQNVWRDFYKKVKNSDFLEDVSINSDSDNNSTS